MCSSIMFTANSTSRSTRWDCLARNPCDWLRLHRRSICRTADVLAAEPRRVRVLERHRSGHPRRPSVHHRNRVSTRAGDSSTPARERRVRELDHTSPDPRRAATRHRYLPPHRRADPARAQSHTRRTASARPSTTPRASTLRRVIDTMEVRHEHGRGLRQAERDHARCCPEGHRDRASQHRPDHQSWSGLMRRVIRRA